MNDQDHDAVEANSAGTEAVPPAQTGTDKAQKPKGVVNALYTELQHKDRQLAAIRRISNAMFPLSDIDTFVRRTLGAAIEVVDAQVGSVQLYNPQSDALVFRYVIDSSATHLMGTSSPISEGINGEVFRTGISNITNDVRQSKHFSPHVDLKTGGSTQSILTVPIKRSAGSPVGVMQVLNGRRPFNQQDIEVMEVLCAQMALGVELMLAKASK